MVSGRWGWWPAILRLFEAGILQPQVVMPGKGVTLCRVEAMEEGAPLVDGWVVVLAACGRRHGGGGGCGR